MNYFSYFLPISRTTLAHYFGCALIKPSKYFDNKPSDDLQDIYDNFLLLTKNIDSSKSDCCLEIILTDNECNDLIPIYNKEWFLFEKALPISRIKKIHFTNKDEMNNTITNIDMSTAYIPKNLIDDKRPQSDDNPIVEFQKPEDCKGLDLTKQISQYDRYLGGLALLKIPREGSMNFSYSYIPTISQFNKVIARDLQNQNVIEPKAKNTWLTSREGEELRRDLELVIEQENVEEKAHKDNINLTKNLTTRIYDFSKLKDSKATRTYIYALLNTYAVGEESRRYKIDTLIVNKFDDDNINKGKKEDVALCYGYNRGYKVFTKSYKVNDKEESVKFKLNSQLDYYIIESVYQYAFNNIVAEQFDYIDDWCPKLETKPTKSNEYRILDTIVIAHEEIPKKKEISLDDFWQTFYGGLATPLKNLFEQTLKSFQEKITEVFENQIAELKTRIEQLERENQSLKIEKGTSQSQLSISRIPANENTSNVSYKAKELEKLKNPELNDMLKKKGLNPNDYPRKMQKIEALASSEMAANGSNLF